MEQNNKKVNEVVEEKVVKKKKIDIRDYKDIDGVSYKRLMFGLWFVSNRRLMIRIVTIVLILISAGLWIYSAVSFISYMTTGREANRILIDELVSTQVTNTRSPINELKHFPVQSFNIDEKYDLIVKISNSNIKHYGLFEYCFVESNVELSCDDDFILPQETKYLSSLSNELNRRPTNVSLVIKKMSWRRINAHIYPNWSDFYSTHIDFSVEDIKFQPANSSQLSEKVGLNSLSFSMSNNTAFSYWQVPLEVILYRGKSVVGVNKYVIGEFLSGEDREIRLVWPGDIGSVSNISIIPEINLLEDDLYMKF